MEIFNKKLFGKFITIANSERAEASKANYDLFIAVKNRRIESLEKEISDKAIQIKNITNEFYEMRDKADELEQFNKKLIKVIAKAIPSVIILTVIVCISAIQVLQYYVLIR